MSDSAKGYEHSEAADSVIAHAKGKMRALGMDPGIGEILCAETLEEAANRVRSDGAMGSAEQFLTYAFSALCATDESIITAAQRSLSPVVQDWELPDDFIGNYIQWGEAGSARFQLKYPDKFNLERSKRLREAMRDFAFKAVRDYLRA